MDDQPKRASFFYSLKAVVWSFFGLRRKRDFDEDQRGMNPLHIIIAALLAVAVFIGLLITVVKFAVK